MVNTTAAAMGTRTATITVPALSRLHLALVVNCRGWGFEPEYFDMESHEIIPKFLESLDREGFSPRTKEWYVVVLHKFQEVIRNDITTITSEDVDKFFSFIRSSDFVFETKKHYLSRLRKFALWLNPDLKLARYRFQTKEKRMLPHETLSLDEIKKLIDATDKIGEKAILSLLYDTGCRPHELLKLKRQDIVRNENGLFVYVPEDTKTGSRQIPVILTTRSDYYLEQYLEANPIKPADKLFPVSVYWLNSLIKNLALKLNFDKRVYSYLFRHSRATYLANLLNEQQLCVYFGWRQGSDMPKIYVHLSGRDILPAVMELNRKLREGTL